MYSYFAQLEAGFPIERDSPLGHMIFSDSLSSQGSPTSPPSLYFYFSLCLLVRAVFDLRVEVSLVPLAHNASSLNLFVYNINLFSHHGLLKLRWRLFFLHFPLLCHFSVTTNTKWSVSMGEVVQGQTDTENTNKLKLQNNSTIHS